MLRWLAACVLLSVVALAACGGADGSSKVDGVIISVDAPTLTQLNSFTLHTDDDRTLVFHIAPNASRNPQNGLAGGHLRSHSLAATRVQITYRKQGDTLLAESILDL
jgi:hypothetical protein